ncbi:MAG: Hint domain-containing protein [Polyangiaceae bacterium]|nr:Hint domain-containing protein [Polyangiaceae bacterium]
MLKPNSPSWNNLIMRHTYMAHKRNDLLLPLSLRLSVPLALAACTSCFSAATRIRTPRGKRRIEDIEVGDDIFAFDHSAGQIVPSKVLTKFVHSAAPVVRIHPQLMGEVTLNHPVFDARAGGYQAIHRLQIQSRLQSFQGNKLTPSSSEVGNLREADVVFNLEVAQHNNYFVKGVHDHESRWLQLKTGRLESVGAEN